MAELRRIQLTTVPSNVPLPHTLPKIPPEEESATAALQNGKVETSLRLVLALFEPDQRRCPEFYYPELVKKKNSATKEPSKSLGEEGNQRAVEAIAKKFEEKYGGTKRKKDRMQDLIDMGYGYDETDSFIDNSEAYDELVPASLTTKYGGFYINSGTLQFRQASGSESDDFINDEKKKLKSPKKRKLKDGEVKSIKKKRDGQHKKMKMMKAGIMPLNVAEEKRRRKQQSSVLAVSDMMKKFEKAKEEPQQLPPVGTQCPTQCPTQLAREPDAGLSVTDPLLSFIGSTNESDLLQAASAIDFDIDLDKLLYESPEPSPCGMDENSDPMVVGQVQKQPPSFPEGLPSALEKRVRELTEAARGSEGEGKQKFFTQDVNSILLDIEIQSRELNSPVRSGVYAYLASFLPCSKDTLVKRAKKLHLHEQDGRLKEPLQKLKDAIGRSMPEQIAKYQVDCQAHTQAKFAKMLEEGKEKEKACSEEEEDEEKSGKRVMGPRKKFQWNDEIRDFLCTVVELKIGRYELERIKSQTAEEYLKAFLEAEVKPLWPKGWMQSRILFKESRRVHSHITCMQTKKKVITAPKVKSKESLMKMERKINCTMPASGCTKVVPAAAMGAVLGPAASLAPSAVGQGPSGVDTHSYVMDDSLDGDLIHNPPSLGAVSEELAALNHDGKGSADFCFPLACKTPPDSMPALTSLEERSKLSGGTVCLAPAQSPLNLLAEQALALGQLSQERKSDGTQLLVIPGYKDILSAQALLDAGVQAKVKGFSMPKVSQAAATTSSPTPKPLLQHGQQQKCFPAQVQYSLGTLLGSSQGVPPKYASLCTTTQPASSKTQTLLPPSSSVPIIPSSSGKMVPPQASPASYLAKPHNAAVPYKPAFSLPATAAKVGTTQSRVAQGALGSLASVTSVIALHRSSPAQVPGLSSPGSAAKKSAPSASSQKLTLVAPPSGENGDSTNGSPGVARLLTSSLNTTVSVSTQAAAPVAAPSQAAKGTTGAPALSSSASQSLSLLSPSFSAAGQTLGILPPMVPMHTLSFPIISFSPESAPQPLASKDAVVTGPAPGTFRHGLAHSMFAGLHSSSLHPPQLAQSTLSHLQQSLKDGSQVHGECPNTQRKLP